MTSSSPPAAPAAPQNPIREAPAPRTTAGRVGGAFLKRDDIKAALPPGQKYLFFEIERRAVSREMDGMGVAGPAVGRFGVDLPVSFRGSTAILTIPTWTDDYAQLVVDFGSDLDDWIGQSIGVWVAPALDRNNNPTEWVHFASAKRVVDSMPKQGSLHPEIQPSPIFREKGAKGAAVDKAARKKKAPK